MRELKKINGTLGANETNYINTGSINIASIQKGLYIFYLFIKDHKLFIYL